MQSEQIINLYKQGLGAPAIAKKLNTTNHYVYKAIKQAGLSVRSHREKSIKYKADHNYFDVIDTEEKAYWLGFMAADGYQTQIYIGCTLSVKDIQHLEKLRCALSAEHPVKIYNQSSRYSNGKQYCRLQIASPELCEGLAKNGVGKRKTHTLRFPDLPKSLRIHFIRGYFDGDGCWAKSKKSKSGFTMKICGTKEFLLAVAQELELPESFVRPHKSIYTLEKSGKGVLDIMNAMYLNANVYLDRKRDRWFVAQSLLGVSLVE